MRLTGCVLVTLVLSAARLGIGAPIAIIDQQNLVGPDLTGPNIMVGSSFGQSFTPALGGIDAVELMMRTSGGSSQVRVDLLAGSGTVGAALASSTRTITNPTTATIHFDFPSRVPLVPGNPYTLRLQYVTGNAPLYVVNITGNPYAGGIAYDVDSVARPDADFVFVEGMHVPEPATCALAAMGSLWACWRRRRIVR